MKTTCNILLDDEILFENMKVTINISTDLLEPWSGRLFFNRDNIFKIFSIFKPFDTFGIELENGQKGKFKIAELESTGCNISALGQLY